MPKYFEWVPDISRGEWLRPMENEPLGSILSVVPRGFEAYARLFHPVERDRPRDTGSWNGIDQATHFDRVPDIGAALETERATWADVARAFGTTMHAEAQFARLARRDYGDVAGVIDADGWRYGNADEGCLDAESFAVASAVLARHTSTPDAGVAAIWEGWGGLTSPSGTAYLAVSPFSEWFLNNRVTAAAGRAVASACSYVALQRSWRNQPKPGSGLLSQEAAAGPHLDLHGDTGRTYILFEAGAHDLADAAWPGRAPWVDEVRWAQSPSILWPDDHAWVLATEIDFDSTLIAGSNQLIRELVQTPGLEVLPIRPDADLTWDGDSLNRP